MNRSPQQQWIPVDNVYAEQSQATLALILGLLGFLVMPLLAPFAWAIGSREISGIKAGRRPPENRTMARIGQILGILMSVFLILIVVLVVLLFGLSVAR